MGTFSALLAKSVLDWTLNTGASPAAPAGRWFGLAIGTPDELHRALKIGIDLSLHGRAVGCRRCVCRGEAGYIFLALRR
jgi:hypothetical protein